jgi:hypothetical protein
MTLKFKVVLLALLLAVGVTSCGSEEHQGAANKAPAVTPAPAPAPVPPGPPPTPPKDEKPTPPPAPPAPPK